MNIFELFKKDKKTPLEKEQAKAYKFLNEYREKFIPKEYNQIELVNYLLDDTIDWYISISTRTDGKSFNYIGSIMALSYEFNTGFTLIARHFTLRKVYFALLQKICDSIEYFDGKKLTCQTTDHFIIVFYDDKAIGVISDLNTATDLKYASNYLASFPIIIYDEFLAISSDYLPDEDERLKTIYESLDRDFSDDCSKIIQAPKIMLLGNAVNFSSPLLAYLDLFNKLEKQPKNTMKRYDNLLLEMRKNDNSNKQRNLRAFKSENDSMTTGQFTYNKFGLVTEHSKEALKHGDYVKMIIKHDDRYIEVTYNKDHQLINIKVQANAETYDYHTNLVDLCDNAEMLKKSFYKEKAYKKHEKNTYLYENAYSREFITSDPQLKMIDFVKLVNYHYYKVAPNETQFDKNERHYKDQYIENTKKTIYKKFFS